MLYNNVRSFSRGFILRFEIFHLCPISEISSQRTSERWECSTRYCQTTSFLPVIFSYQHRFQGDDPTVLPFLEQVAEKPKETMEKPPPQSRPLRRSHTDPTDLLWVFRRRASLLAQQNNPHRALPRRKNGVVGPFQTANEGYSFEAIPESSEGLVDKVCANITCY